ARTVADDLVGNADGAAARVASRGLHGHLPAEACGHFQLMLTTCTGSVMPFRFISRGSESADRKSTRLNSSHLGISYAVFGLKKKIHEDLAPHHRDCGAGKPGVDTP